MPLWERTFIFRNGKINTLYRIPRGEIEVVLTNLISAVTGNNIRARCLQLFNYINFSFVGHMFCRFDQHLVIRSIFNHTRALRRVYYFQNRYVRAARARDEQLKRCSRRTAFNQAASIDFA